MSELKFVRETHRRRPSRAHQLIKRDSVAAPPGGKRDG
jgi:hypothetical protein